MDEALHLRAAEGVRPERLAQLNLQGFLAYDKSDDISVCQVQQIHTTGWGSSGTEYETHPDEHVVSLLKISSMGRHTTAVIHCYERKYCEASVVRRQSLFLFTSDRLRI